MVLFVGDHFGIGAYKINVVVVNSLYLSCMGAYYVIVISLPGGGHSTDWGWA